MRSEAVRLTAHGLGSAPSLRSKNAKTLARRRSGFDDPRVRGEITRPAEDIANHRSPGYPCRLSSETRQGRRRPETTLSRDAPRDAAHPSDAIPRHAKGGGAPESTLSRDTPREAAYPSRRYPETRQGRQRTRDDAIPRGAKGGGAPETTLSRDAPRDAASVAPFGEGCVRAYRTL